MRSFPANERILFSLLIFFACVAAEGAPAQSVPPVGSATQFAELSAQAASARDGGRTGDAIRAYRSALRLRPEWAEGWWYLGTLNYDADHFAEAIAALQNLVALRPKMGQAFAFLGLSEFEVKDYENALAHLQQAQAQGYEDDAELAQVSAYHLALLLNRSGQFDAAMRLLAPQIQRTGGPERSPAQLRVALGLALLRVPLLPAEVYPAKDALIDAAGDAAALLERGDFAAAADALGQLLVDHPQTPFLRSAYAEALAGAGKNEESLRQRALSQEMEFSPAEVNESQRRLYSANPPLPLDPASSLSSAENFETLARKAQASQAAGQIDAAVSLYRQALAQRPEWEQGWRNLGAIDYASQRYADAIAPLTHAAALAPQDGNAWALLGLCEFETKDYDNALIHLQRGRGLGLAGSPAAIRIAGYRLALLLNRSGDFDAASGLLASAATSGSLDDRERFAAGMSLLRIPALPEGVDPRDRPMIQLAGTTSSLLYESKYDAAFSRFQQALKMNPNTPYLHYAYGCALASISRYDEAEEQLAEESRITPRSPLPFLRRSSIALQLHHAEDALKMAKQAAQLEPDGVESHLLLGRSWLELGRTTDAIQELEAARGLAPSSPEVRFLLARAYAKAGQSGAAERERGEFARLNALAQRPDQSGAPNPPDNAPK